MPSSTSIVWWQGSKRFSLAEQVTAAAVFGSSSTTPGSDEWRTAEDVGRRLALAGLAVVTGGYGGTMEAVSRGAASQGAPVVGVTAPHLFPQRQGANPFVTEVVEAAGLTDRIGIMIERSSAALALPGSIGTATELLIAWNVNHIVRRNGGVRYPTVAVGEEWRQVAETLSARIGAFAGDVHLAATGTEAVAWLLEELKIL